LKRTSSILFTCLLALSFLTACGDDNSSGEPEASAESQDVSAILAAASTRIGETQTMKFTLDVQGTTMIDSSGTIQLLGARGALARPNLVDVQFQIKLLGTQTASIKMITSGDQSWTTDLISGNWGPAPAEFGYDPSRLFDTQDGLGPVMGKVENAQLVGSESVGDRESWHIRGTVLDDVIGPITAHTMNGEAVTLDLWVDNETSDLLRIRLSEPTDEGIEDPATWTMELREHDEPVTIEPPI
jgi:hypothetical protein